jgi:tetratricopeptide (TPR) repeat protein
LGKYSDAVNDYRKVLSLDSLHKNARLNLAYACYGAKLPSEAEFHFNEAVRIFGSSADVYESRAWFRLETGRYALSLEDYDHVLKMGQSSPKVWLGRGWANYYLGNLAEAEADLMKSLGTEGGSPDSWYCLGEICLSSGKKDEACVWFEKAAKAGHPKASELLVKNCSN